MSISTFVIFVLGSMTIALVRDKDNKIIDFVSFMLLFLVLNTIIRIIIV